MCMNCTFSLENNPNQCMECDICIRNPKNASIRFQPVMYKEIKIERPIDMYISRELMEILKREIRKMYEEGLRRGQPHIPLNPPEYVPWSWWWSQGKQSFASSNQTNYNSGDTLTITYTISIPTGVEIEDTNSQEPLSRLDDSTNKKVIKIVCIDVEEILQAMDGVEVSEAN